MSSVLLSFYNNWGRKGDLVEQEARNGDERMVLRVGRAVVVGDAVAAGDGFQVAQHEVDGGEAANAVAILNGRNLLVKIGGVAVEDGGHQVVVGCLEVGAALLVHDEVVAEVGTDVGKIDGGDDQSVLAFCFLSEGFDNGR